MARKIIAWFVTVAFVAVASFAVHGVAGGSARTSFLGRVPALLGAVAAALLSRLRDVSKGLNPMKMRFLSVFLASVCVSSPFLPLIPASASAASTDRPLVIFPAGVSCPAIMVYAIRGSGEKLSDDHGAGSQLWPVYQQLVKEYGARHVGLEANAYPAVPVTDPWVHLPDLWYLLHDYKPSVNRGVADAVADITGYARKCHRGDHALVIAGYSQGADVARRALARINPASTFSVGMRVSLSVLLFGDPNFNPAERDQPPYDGTADEQGSFQAREGVGRWADRYLHVMPVAPRLSFWYNLRSWCYHGDPVCQVGGLHFAVHSRYAARYAYAATTFVSGDVPQQVATPDCIFLRSSPSSRRIEVSPDYFPAPSNPGGTTVLTTYIDGRLVDSRTIRFVSIGENQDFSIWLPNDHKLHVVTSRALGQVIEEEPFQSP